MEEIYFGTKDGDLLDNYEIAKIAFIITGKRNSPDDFENVREFSKMCKGIEGEVKNPSIKRLIKNGYKAKAVKICYRKHHGISLIKAKEIVDSMEDNMNKSKGRL